MAGELTIPFKGNLTADPELRFTPSGAAVCKFRVADTPRVFDRDSNSYKDGKTNFKNIQVWREQAENCAETLRKGMAVVGYGIVKTDEWTDKESGQPRSQEYIEATEVGPSLRWATGQITRANRGGSQGGGQQGGWGDNQQSGGGQSAPQNDGWGGGGQSQPQSGGQQGGSDPWGGGNATQDAADPWA